MKFGRWQRLLRFVLMALVGTGSTFALSTGANPVASVPVVHAAAQDTSVGKAPWEAFLALSFDDWARMRVNLSREGNLQVDRPVLVLPGANGLDETITPTY